MSTQDTNQMIPEWSRIIVHADMDAFFAAVEELDNPDLRHRPVVVGGNSARSVVATANYNARQYGIGSAMPMATARRRCRDLVIVPPRMERYRSISRQVMEVFRMYTDLVEPLSMDEAFLDVSKAIAQFPNPMSLGRQIKNDVLKATNGLTVSVGISTTKAVSKIASDMNKPDGLTIVYPNEVLDFLAPLPVKRLWGAGPKAVAQMQALGLITIGDVAQANADVLGQLGRQGRHYARLARGVDFRSVKPRGRPKSVGWERTLTEDISGQDAILEHLKGAAEGVSQRLKKRTMRARGVRLKLKTNRFETLTRQTCLTEPTDDPQAILITATELLDLLSSVGPFRLVGLTAYDLVTEDDGIQLTFPISDRTVSKNS